MALFKILRGDSDNLKEVKGNDGYAYFTPDDGKFYIDIASTDTKDQVVIGKEAPQGSGVTRVCINDNNFYVLDCGNATTE